MIYRKTNEQKIGDLGSYEITEETYSPDEKGETNTRTKKPVIINTSKKQPITKVS